VPNADALRDSILELRDERNRESLDAQSACAGLLGLRAHALTEAGGKRRRRRFHKPGPDQGEEPAVSQDAREHIEVGEDQQALDPALGLPAPLVRTGQVERQLELGRDQAGSALACSSISPRSPSVRHRPTRSRSITWEGWPNRVASTGTASPTVAPAPSASSKSRSVMIPGPGCSGSSTTAAPDLRCLLASWTVHLRAERKSPSTIESYTTGVRLFLAYCTDAGCPAVLDRSPVNAFVAGLLNSGAEAATARSRQLSVRRFSSWLAEEGETVRDESLGLKPPKLHVKIVPPLTDDQCRALVKACAGREFIDRRDEALIRFMLETTARSGEVLAMSITDIDITRGLAVISRGEGGKGRPVPFGPQTGRALDRYLRVRRTHRLAELPAFWLGGGGQRFGYRRLGGGEQASRARVHRRLPLPGPRVLGARVERSAGTGQPLPPGGTSARWRRFLLTDSDRGS